MNFDPAIHEYRDGDAIIPSVTQVLKRAGLINDHWYSEEARERGSAVHTLCERYAHGARLDDAGRTLASLEYINAFAAWMKRTRAYAIETEQFVDHALNGRRYAGRFDLMAEIDGFRVLIDLKTGAKDLWHPVQMAAYALPTNPERVMILYLKADGRYVQSYLTPSEIVHGIQQFKDALAQGVKA